MYNQTTDHNARGAISRAEKVVSPHTGLTSREARTVQKNNPARQAPPSTLAELLDVAAKMARHLFDKSGTLTPLFLCQFESGDLEYVVPTGAINDKKALADGMRDLFKSRPVKRYVSIMEVWTSALPPGGKYGQSLATHPDRGEAVFLCAEDKSEALVAEMTIVRPKRGKPKLAKLRKLAAPRYGVGGRFAGLLRERTDECTSPSMS